MNFNPKTEEEVKRGKLLKPGECDFEVKKATDEVSTNNNEMIKLQIQVWDADGQTATVFDYLMEAMPAKLRHACFAVGLGESYESGALLADDFVGRTGRCVIYTEPAKGQYDAKNAVRDYVVPDAKPAAKPPSVAGAVREKAKAATAASGAPFDDTTKQFDESEIPFSPNKA